MTGHRELIQDLRAHAHEAPAECAALMRLAATELERGSPVIIRGVERALTEFDPEGAPCS